MFLVQTGVLIGMIIAIVVLIVVIGIIAWYISAMNNLRRLNVKVEEAMSGIDVALTKRYDALTKMLDTTKAYAKYEAETLEKIVKLRKGMNSSTTLEDRKEFASSMDEMQKRMSLVIEQYPQLKADHNFGKLQDAIMDTEEHLQAARRSYNANVRALNSAIISFPSSIVAKRIHMEQRDFFEAEESKKQDVKMEF